MSTNLRYELRCRECQTRWGNQPISFCQNCFAPLEVAYDWDRIRKEISKDKIAAGLPTFGVIKNCCRCLKILIADCDARPTTRRAALLQEQMGTWKSNAARRVGARRQEHSTLQRLPASHLC